MNIKLPVVATGSIRLDIFFLCVVALFVNLKKNIKKFYIKFCESFRNKFNFNNKLLAMFNNFVPENVISGTTNSIGTLFIN